MENTLRYVSSCYSGQNAELYITELLVALTMIYITYEVKGPA